MSAVYETLDLCVPNCLICILFRLLFSNRFDASRRTVPLSIALHLSKPIAVWCVVFQRSLLTAATASATVAVGPSGCCESVALTECAEQRFLCFRLEPMFTGRLPHGSRINSPGCIQSAPTWIPDQPTKFQHHVNNSL